ncbi:hypothetical protein DFJ63DRAFT_312994 [Scheffersomyces coipomensis]|uniref:uncharacterized protein n=1 Tax=Scheffersomyces coipomensis TaxID=1788519 RepID=UPI00315DEC96
MHNHPTNDDHDSESSRRDDHNESSSSSEYDSNQSSSDEDSSSSEEEEKLMLKPIFVSKSKRQSQDQLTPTTNSKDITISKLDNLTQDDKLDVSNLNDDNNFDGIDDTDDIDPEQEYNAWKQRELNRYNRDQLILQQQDSTKDDQLRRSQLNETQLIKEFNNRKIQPNDESINTTKSNDKYHKGAFYHDNDDIQQKFLKRNYSPNDNDNDDNDNGKDHSRPTKLKFKKIV